MDVSPQTPPRIAGKALIADLNRDDRRGWLSHGLAALAISALGLAVAGSVTITTNAQPVTSSTVTTTVRPSTQQISPPPGLAQASPAVDETTQALAEASLTSFQTRDAAASQTSRSTLRVAQVKERVAARAEDLSKTAESISRAARSETAKLRSRDLQASDRAARENAVRIAEEARERAVAARVAAARARAEAEVAAQAQRELARRELARSNQNTTVESRPAPEVRVERPAAPERRASEESASRESSRPRSSGGSASPVPGAVIGAHFGQYGLWSRYHTGLDFRAGYGVKIRAVKSGVVLFAGNSGDWSGNHVAIKHGDGKTTMSSHMSSMAVSSGERVEAGQVIGYVGATGRAFGAHLHFELYPEGVRYGDVYSAIDPQPWLRAIGVDVN